MRIRLGGAAASVALALIVNVGLARADGSWLKASESRGCRGGAANENACARIRGYIAAGGGFVGEERSTAPPTFRPLPAIRPSGTAFAPRPTGSGFDGRFLLDVRHDASFR